jgi:hypothetical protein
MAWSDVRREHGGSSGVPNLSDGCPDCLSSWCRLSWRRGGEEIPGGIGAA